MPEIWNMEPRQRPTSTDYAGQLTYGGVGVSCGGFMIVIAPNHGCFLIFMAS